MNSRKRLNAVYIIIISIAFVCVLAVSFLFFIFPEKEIPLTLKITSNNVTKTIEPWYDDSGKWYFFIPSYSSKENTVISAEGKGCCIQDKELSGEDDLDEYEFGKEYHFEQHSFFSNWDTTVVFKKSANVATMYIDTQSGDMNRIHSNRYNEEKMNMALYGEDGEILYDGNKYDDEIKGHGNATWRMEKKSYKINLSKSVELLKMPEAQKWVLLANCYDETNLRNKLVYDFAKKVDMGWTPHCEYIDLYLNGEYNGLYLLSEKIEVNNSRLALNDLNNDFLFEGIEPRRIQQDDLSFNICDNKYFLLNFPTKCDNGRMLEIQKNVNQLDSEINSGNLVRIDVDSWVKRFLIDEIFINYDAIQYSSYYHYDFLTSKFYCGPIWDYDISFGNAVSINLGTLKSKNPNQIWCLKKYWYSQLYQNEAFYESLKQIYQNDYLPKLKNLLTVDLPYMTNQLSDSSLCNSIRWDAMFKIAYLEDKELDERVNELSEFLTARLSYLEPIWCSDKQYEIVRWYAADKKTLLYITPVEHGKVITEYPNENGVTEYDWCNFDNNLLFDFSQSVMSDLNLYSNSDQPATETEQVVPQGLINYLIAHKSFVMLAMLCASLALLGLILVCLDIKRNRKRRNR